MPRTRSLAWSELKLGVLTIVAMGLAGFMIFMLTGDSGFFWQRYSLKTRFGDIAGLKLGSPVRIAGKEVGLVTAMDFAGEQVDVTFQVHKDQRERITTNSFTKLGSISLLGESSVDITPSLKGAPIPDWGYVPSGRPVTLLADVTDQAGQGIQELTGLMQDMRKGKGTLGKFVTDDKVYNELQRTVATMSDLADDIKQGKGSIGKLLTDKTTADELERSMKNVEALTAQLNSGEGSVGKLLKDDSFANSLAAATDSLQALVAKVNRGEGSLGKAMTDTALYDRATSTLDRLDKIVTNLNNGEGTMGQLLKDKQLYENMNKAISDVTSLVDQIKADPKKYLQVKVGIFQW
jgi:phospholipid/cholesterol/gamma-HCH transport system substrate-binding protein